VFRTRRGRVSFAIIASAAMVACASSGATPPAPSDAQSQPAPQTKSGTCDASKVQWAIGQAGDQATMGRIWRESGAGLFRPLIKGQTPLQDHKPDRVNIHLDENNRIVSIDCG